MQRVTGHSLHFTLKFASSDWPSPVTGDQLRLAQIIFDFSFDLCLRSHRIKRRLRRTILLRPNPVPPINFLNGTLISYALCERESSLRNLRARFRTQESRQRSAYHRTSRRCANEKGNHSAQIYKSGSSAAFLLHRHKLWTLIEAGRPDFLLKAGKHIKLKNRYDIRTVELISLRRASLKTRIENSIRVLNLTPPMPFRRITRSLSVTGG